MEDVFTKESLNDAVGEKGLSQLESVALDKGSAFLSNQITSSFVKLSKTTTAKVLANDVNIGINAYNVAADTLTNAPEIINDLVQKIIAKATEIITEKSTELVLDYTKKHLLEIQKLPMAINNHAMKVFEEEKKSVGEILEELGGDAEEKAKKKEEEQNKKQQNSFMARNKEKITKITADVTAFAKVAGEKVSMVTDYIEEGPDWVIDQLNKQCQSGIDYVKKLINEQWQKDKKQYDTFAENQGRELGLSMAEKYNDTLKKAQKDMLDDQETKSSKAITKAKTAILGNALSIAAQTGIL